MSATPIYFCTNLLTAVVCLSHPFLSPQSGLNSKKITSQDNIGGMGSGVASVVKPLIGLPPTTRTGAARDDSGPGGFGSLPKKKNDLHTSEMDPSSFASPIVTDSGTSENSDSTSCSTLDTLTANTLNHHPNSGSGQQQQVHAQSDHTTTGNEQGHSRNSSNTSQVKTKRPIFRQNSVFPLGFDVTVANHLKFLYILADVQRIGLQQFFT